MERMRSKAKAEKAEKNWKRLQEGQKKESSIGIDAKLEKVEVDKEDSQNPPLKEIA